MMDAKNALAGGTVMVALVTVFAGPAPAQKIQDRHPAMAERPLTFEERWEPVRELLVRKAWADALEWRETRQNAPAVVLAPPVPERPVRTVQVATIRKPDRETCQRHGLRTVWTGQTWRCRR